MIDICFGVWDYQRKKGDLKKFKDLQKINTKKQIKRLITKII